MDIDYNSRCSGQLLKVMEQFHLIKDSIIKSIQINMESNKESIKILDIGASHGFNSNIQLSYIIHLIRNEMKLSKLIEVYHNDQESNNFSELFKFINNSSDSYLKRFDNIYSFGKGSSFIYQLLPNGSCDIICSFYTLQWVDLDCLPSHEKEPFKRNLKDHFIICQQSIPNYIQFEQDHLNRVMEHRYNELKVGGTFVCNLLCFETDAIVHSYKSMKSIFRNMANEGILSHDEVDNMFATLLYFKKESIEKVMGEWSLKGFQVKERTDVYIDWREENRISNPTPDSNQDKVYYGESILSYCGPSFRNAIKGDDDKVNQIYNLFKSRFIESINSDFKIIFGFVFLVLTKVN